jgi:UMF1 family MFS transporter
LAVKIEKPVWGWVAYDWANSAFATTVMAGFFPIFFKGYWSVDYDTTESTALLGYANSFAGILVAAAGPLLGAAADKARIRKRMLLVFAYLGSISTAALYFVEKGNWPMASAFYLLGVTGFSCSIIFYDSLLPSIAGAKRVDSLSGLGFSAGYLGGGLLFLLNVIMTLTPESFGIQDKAQAVRLSFLSVAVWWGGFTLFTLFWVPRETKGEETTYRRALSAGLKQMVSTLTNLKRHRSAAVFLLAYWCYIDGVDTIIRMAVDYGLSIGFGTEDLIAALLLVQFVGFPAALLFGRIGQELGPRGPIFFTLFVYVGVTCWGVFMTERWEFYALAVAIGTVQGGAQCLSRSYFARLVPSGQEAEFFGFYNMVGKTAVILGPALMGTVGLLFRGLIPPLMRHYDWGALSSQAASRASMASLLILFAAGIWFLHLSREKGR